MEKKVLDVCCGSRMFWFDKNDPRAVFADIREETVVADSREGRRTITIKPDVLADFTSLPFAADTFSLVVFDPPHLKRNGAGSWMAKKYGKIPANFLDQYQQAFKECFRVLKKDGVLVFKWNEIDIPVSQILSLTSNKPLFGNRCGKQSKTHWIVFMK